MILVAGGTGRLGSLVVAGLVAKGKRVRVLTRDADRAAHLADPLVEVVVGDVREPSSLPPAFLGVDTVVSAVQGFVGPGRVTPQSVDRDGNAHLVAAAQAAGADMVLVSVVGAAADHPMELFRMKAAAEQHLRDSPVAWTIVHSTGFLELYLDLMRRTAGRSKRPVVFGRGQNPINFASVADVADAVIRASVDPTLRGQVIEVVGQDLTLNQVAELVQQELGSTGKKSRHVPRAILHVLAATGIVANSAPARQARAGLVMDTAVMTVVAERPAADDQAVDGTTHAVE
jgi:NADH dehydrogenase